MQFEGFLVFVATFVVSTATPLDDYVQRDDGVFSYSEVREPFWGDTSTLYFVNMTSQRWLTGTTAVAYNCDADVLICVFYR